MEAFIPELKRCFKSNVKPRFIPTAIAAVENKEMLDYDELARRIRVAMDEGNKKITLAAVGDACGVSPQAVHGWRKTGRVDKRHLLALAQLTGKPLGFFLSPDGDEANTEPGPELRGQVPIISWVQAGSFCQSPDLFVPGDAEEWTPTTVPIHAHTFALRIKGDSMTNPNGDPTFPNGSVIVVEPDAVDTPEKLVGAFVIVKRTGEDEATFKQLVRDGSRFYLRPLNPQYPMLELRPNDRICGVVREKVMRFF